MGVPCKYPHIYIYTIFKMLKHESLDVVVPTDLWSRVNFVCKRGPVRPCVRMDGWIGCGLPQGTARQGTTPSSHGHTGRNALTTSSSLCMHTGLRLLFTRTKKKKEKVWFTLFNYRKSLIFNFQVRNRTTQAIQLSKPGKFSP